MHRIAIVVAVAACGRVGFSERFALDGGTDSDAALNLGPCSGSSLDCAGAVACRDFEGADFDDWSYECDGDDYQCSPAVPEVALEIVATPRCNGDGVYRAFTTGGPGSRQNAYLGQFVDAALADEVFVRFAMRWPQGTNIAGRPIVLVPLDPSGSAPRLGLGRNLGELRVRLMDESHFFAAPIAADRWSCIELHLTANEVEVWVDGDSKFTRAGPTIPPNTGFDIVALGIIASADEGPTEIYFDDFAISPARIGCPQN